MYVSMVRTIKKSPQGHTLSSQQTAMLFGTPWKPVYIRPSFSCVRKPRDLIAHRFPFVLQELICM